MRSIIVLLFITTASFGQKKVASVNVASSIAYAAVDRPGDLYVVLTDGQILKYDNNIKTKIAWI